MTGNAPSWIRILNHSLNGGSADLYSVRLNADIVPTLQHIESTAFQRGVTAPVAAICSRRISTHTDGGRQ